MFDGFCFDVLGFVARSPVFQAMLNAPMPEAAQNTIEIPYFEEDVVKAMLDYIYTGDTEDLVSGFNVYISSSVVRFAVGHFRWKNDVN